MNLTIRQQKKQLLQAIEDLQKQHANETVLTIYKTNLERVNNQIIKEREAYKQRVKSSYNLKFQEGHFFQHGGEA